MAIVINGTGTISGVNAGGLTSASNGRILQVVQTFKNDTFTTASTSFVDITGMSVSITPTSASNRILVLVSLVGGATGNTFRGIVRLMRDSTSVGNGVPSGTRNGGIGALNAGSYQALAVTTNFLDSPATTSSVTYKLQGLAQSGSSLTVNRTGDDSDDPTYGRYSSMITVMEIAA